MSTNSSGQFPSTHPPSNLSEHPPGDGDGNSAWKIAVGVSVPLVIFIGIVVTVYILYRRKYPVRMIIGREFSKVRNPNYDRPRSDATLVRDDADAYFRAQMEAAAVGLNEFNPTNQTLSFERENLGYESDEDEYENENKDEDHEDREFRLRKGWLFKRNSDEDVQDIYENENKADADTMGENNAGDSGSDSLNVEAMLAERKTTPIPTRKQLQADASEEDSHMSDSNASDDSFDVKLAKENQKAVTVDVVDSCTRKFATDNVTDVRSMRSHSLTAPSLNFPSRPRSYSVDLNQSARNMSMTAHDILTPDIFFEQFKFSGQSLDVSVVSSERQPRGSFYSSTSSLSNQVKDHAVSFSSVNSNPHLVTDLDDSEEDDATMNCKNDLELNIGTGLESEMYESYDFAAFQNSKNGHEDTEILKNGDNEKSLAQNYIKNTANQTEQSTKNIELGDNADQCSNEPIYENLSIEDSVSVLNTDFSHVQEKEDETNPWTEEETDSSYSGVFSQTQNTNESLPLFEHSNSSDSQGKKLFDKLGSFDNTTEKERESFSVLREYPSDFTEDVNKNDPFSSQGGSSNIEQLQNTDNIEDENEAPNEKHQEIINASLKAFPKSMQKSNCENLSTNIVKESSLIFSNQNWQPSGDTTDLHESTNPLGHGGSSKIPYDHSINSMDFASQEKMSVEVQSHPSNAYHNCKNEGLDIDADQREDVSLDCKEDSTPSVEADNSGSDQAGGMSPINNTTALGEQCDSQLNLNQSLKTLAKGIDEFTPNDDSPDFLDSSDSESSTSKSSSEGHFEEYSFESNLEPERDGQRGKDHFKKSTIIAKNVNEQSVGAESPNKLNMSPVEHSHISFENEMMTRVTKEFPMTEDGKLNYSISSQSGSSNVDDVSLSDFDELPESAPKSTKTEEEFRSKMTNMTNEKEKQQLLTNEHSIGISQTLTPPEPQDQYNNTHSSSRVRSLKLVSAVEFSEGSSNSSDEESVHVKSDVRMDGLGTDVHHHIEESGGAGGSDDEDGEDDKELTLEEINDVLNSDVETNFMGNSTAITQPQSQQTDVAFSFDFPKTFDFSQGEEDIDV